MAANEDSKTVLDKATNAIHGVAETVQSTTEIIADAIEDSRRWLASNTYS